MLHPIITGSIYNGQVPKLTPKELFSYALNDDCLLTRCLYALGTSYSSWDPDKAMTNAYWASSLMAAFTASELIGRLVRKGPSYLQNCIAKQLNFSQASSSLKAFLCFLRISSSPMHMDRNETEYACQRLLDGVKRGPYDFICLSTDNLGFKKKRGMSSEQLST